tara:strand:- start:2650 stop:2955 length:306 start_codon:yes stop_codon:yes gene_type:complete
MDEIEEWFLEEFGHLGFSTTPTLYNPFDFTPSKGVMYNDRLTNIKIIPEMVNDISGGFVPLPNPVVEYKQLLREAVELFLNENGVTTDFTPNRNIIRFRFV